MTNKIAMIFPGQGSQTPGMLAELSQRESIIIDTFKEASEVLGVDLWDVTQNNPKDLLNQTAYTQPILLAASVALWRIWCQQNEQMPQIMAGHSLGEYSALVCAEAVAFKDAIDLVHKRGLYMQEAVPQGKGAMAAIIGLTPDKVAKACDMAAKGATVSSANFNAIGQIVISGEKEAVERAIVNAKELGAKIAKLLPVSVPSHCQLMAPAADKLAEVLNTIEIQLPSIPVLHNADVSISHTIEAIKDKLIKQLYSPVRWVETIEMMSKEGVDTLYECGPGKVLAGLNKRIVKSMTVNALDV